MKAIQHIPILIIAVAIAAGCVGQVGRDGQDSDGPASARSSTTNIGNVVRNGDFEINTLANWTTTGHPAVAGLGHTGSHAAELVSGSADTQGSISQTIAIPSGAGGWLLSFWWYSTSADCSATITVSLGPAGSPTRLYESCPPPAATWQEAILDVTSFAGSKIDLTFVATNSGNNQLLVDDISVMPMPSTILNGDFESGTLEGWDNVTSFSGGISVGPPPHLGSKAATLGTDTAVWRGDFVLSQHVNVPPGNSLLTLWYSPAPCTPGVGDYVYGQLRDLKQNVLQTLFSVCAADSAWVPVAVDLTPYAGKPVIVALGAHHETVEAGNAITVDDVAITPGTTPPLIVSNGDFELGSAQAWNTTGQIAVSAAAHSGANAMQIGSAAAFQGDSTLTQIIAVPKGTATLSFWYNPHCSDTIQYDQQQAEIRSTTGTTLKSLLDVCESSGTWTQVTADLTPYAGTNVVLWFNDHDDGSVSDPTYYLLDDVSVTVGGKAALVNGDFELGSLAGWSTSGKVSASQATPHGGAWDAQIGSSGPFKGDSTLSQVIVVPTGAPKLSFWYRPYCTDTIQYDQQQAEIRDATGKTTLQSLLNVCDGSGTWTQVNADLTPYAGSTITLWFNDHDDGAVGDPTYFLLDDVAITVK
jgi:hypothetical protein